MSNDINKIDGSNPGVYAPSSKPQTPSTTDGSTKSTAITLSHNLNQMVAMLAEDEAPEQTTRVTQIKQQITDDTYAIDLDNLAEKLTHALINPNGI